MGLFKMTWFFEGLQDATFGSGAAIGWTETWALNQASENIDDAFVNADVLQYTNLRQQCLAQQYRISFLRATNISQPPTVTPRRVKIQSLPHTQGAASNFTCPAAQVQCCVLADLQKLPSAPADLVHHRKFLIRGLPSDVINGNVINTGAANWPKFVTFFNFVAGRPTGVGAKTPGAATMLGVSYQDQVNFPKKNCPALTVDPLNPRMISLNPGTEAYVPGESVRISGFKGLDGVAFNRAWQYVTTDVGPPVKAWFGKSRFDMDGGTTPFPNAASIQRVRLLVGPFDQYAIVGLRSKRTGKVFHQLRGRSARKVKP
jgi:hypothetical protein